MNNGLRFGLRKQQLWKNPKDFYNRSFSLFFSKKFSVHKCLTYTFFANRPTYHDFFLYLPLIWSIDQTSILIKQVVIFLFAYSFPFGHRWRWWSSLKKTKNLQNPLRWSHEDEILHHHYSLGGSLSTYISFFLLFTLF